MGEDSLIKRQVKIKAMPGVAQEKNNNSFTINVDFLPTGLPSKSRGCRNSFSRLSGCLVLASFERTKYEERGTRYEAMGPGSMGRMGRPPMVRRVKCNDFVLA